MVVVVRGGANPRRTGELRRWIRALVPAALILVSSAPVEPGTPDEDVVSVSADELDAGPLAVAAVLARARPPRD